MVRKSNSGTYGTWTADKLYQIQKVSFMAGIIHGGSTRNFGNGFFGTTAISSKGTNASGIGKF